MNKKHHKLDTWDERFQCFVNGKKAYPTTEVARAAAVKPGRYRISTVGPNDRTDGEPFEVARGAVAEPLGKPRKYSPTATRPMSGRPH